MKRTERIFTPAGRMCIVMLIVVMTFMALTILVLVPSRFGFGG